MMSNQQKTKQRNNNMNVLYRSLLTGFIGGILASSFAVFMYYFNFAEVAPKTYVIRPFFKSNWTSNWIGDLLSILIVGILSVLVALLYFILFKKIYAMWLSGLYGLVLWLFIFIVLQPLFENVQKVYEMNSDTIISTICLFLLYGIFIGYSISYDYLDTNKLEDEGSLD